MQRLQYGMIGGGEGAFIGAVHRAGAAVAGLDLTAGAFSRDPENSQRTGAALGLDPARVYGSFEEMIAKERARAPGDRIDFVAVVTPNHMHAPPCIAALEAGFPVMCDKPLAESLETALAIQAVAERTGQLVGVTHTYTGYPMVIQARALVAGGALGRVRRVFANYTQDWLSRPEDTKSSKQADWRTDPKQSGEAGAFGDIGTHAFNMIEFVTGERVSALSARLRAVIPGRTLDDDGSALLTLEGGAEGVLVASQVCSGDDNNLKFSIYCEDGAVHWTQDNINELLVKRRDRPQEIHVPGPGKSYLGPFARAASRVPPGHPEGYIEAFANIYAAFAKAVSGQAAKDPKGNPGFATLIDAISCMRFIRAARVSSEAGGTWIDLAGIRPEQK